MSAEGIPPRFARAEKPEQLRRALPVLLAARRSVIVDGTRDVIDAIQQAGRAGIECHWARGILQDVVTTGSLITWQSDLRTRQSDITRALDRAIRICRHPDVRRGGFTVTHGARP